MSALTYPTVGAIREETSPLSHHQPGFTVSVVVPAKNEARNIAWVLERMPLSVDEVIVVDGNSTDRTIEVARAVRPDVVIVSEPGRGKGTAMRTGFAVARGVFVVVLDADGSMDPRDIDLYVEQLAAGTDLVKGSRYIAGGGSTDLTRVRSLGNRTLLFMSNLIYRQSFTELCYGFMALRTSRIPELRLDATGFEIETEIVTKAVRHGLAVAEVPSREAPRISGASNLHAFRDGLRIVRTILREALPWRNRRGPVPVMAHSATHRPESWMEQLEERILGESTVPHDGEVAVAD
jgi:glycosyltransferase involved in cell wall biosynthesis